MKDDLAAQLRAKAEEMLKQAELLEEQANASPDDQPVEPEPETVNDPEPEAVTGLPDDEVTAERDPLQPMDMKEELKKVRELLPTRGFIKRAESQAGEVWEKPGPNGQQGFRLTLTADVHGRINAEIRDPAGLIIGNASPAQVIDVEIQLQKVR